MEITGNQLIPKAQQQTWNAICDPAVLQICIPGCDSMEKISDLEFQMTMSARVGPVSAKFKARITLTEVNPPSSYKLIFEGQGGVAGFAKGEADVTLTTEDHATRLNYAAKANVGGKIAQIGARLIDGVAKKMAETFFNNFNKHLTDAKS
jgi:uncharacterized protein